MDIDKKTIKGASLFAGGVAFGTAGIKILASKDAKKVYTNCAAAALRAKDFVMKTVTKVQENAEDVMAKSRSPFLRKTHRKRGCQISNSRRS